VVQLAFSTDVDPTTLTYTLTGPNGPVTTSEAYLDNPMDPSSMLCANPSTRQIDIAFTSAPGKSAPWPPGNYTLNFTISSPTAKTKQFSSVNWPGADAMGNLTFNVAAAPSGNSAATDPNIVDLHPLPESNCPCM
jgi:hypothetical protein